ncbi:hypothetical protein FA15DRAFT_698956 [Coprinopsis marcescibilis]|uniref:Uncharacterized protein n=1 Tax=Coprinopsis marcescibilis TaxID=230819 RepID=A0A5C3LF01_COPMA|nr:hypothetical protein FA15DRAFT_698956 [Coprinopsis marcescibilis]
MWPFILERSVALQTHVNATPSEVLQFLQTPEKLCALSPLIKDFSVEGDVVTVSERLPLLGGLVESSTKFKFKLKVLENGILCDIYADMWTTMQNHMWTEEQPDGTTILKERTCVQALFFFIPYVVATMLAAHIAVMKKISGTLAEPGQPMSPVLVRR